MAEPRATLCALPLPPPRGLRKPDHRDFFLGCECVCASCVCLARRGYAHGMFCGDALYASIQGTRGWPSGMRVLVVVAPHLRTVFMYRCRCAFGRVVFVFCFFLFTHFSSASRRTKTIIHSPQRSHRGTAPCARGRFQGSNGGSSSRLGSSHPAQSGRGTRAGKAWARGRGGRRAPRGWKWVCDASVHVSSD